MSKEKRGLTVADLEQRVADKFIEMLEHDGLRSFTMWATARPCANAITGHVYRGSNVLNTAIAMMCGEWEDTRFMTFNQARSIGACVRKGEKGTPISFYGVAQDKKDPDRTYKFGKVMYVWNVEQIDDVDESHLVPLSTHEPPTNPDERNAAIDTFVANTGAQIRTGTAAFFQPMLDTITMPPFEDFLPNVVATQAENYYSVLMHELTHWTGHESRLDRLNAKTKRSKEYAFEELVAEIGSVMLAVQLGFKSQPDETNAAYVQGWIRNLTDHPGNISRAAAEAGKALSLLNDLQPAQQAESEAA